ncbi:hypothetical protein FHR83_008364 [Actinoplanes campanulatus]|uniref:Uncharacterized protein n=1 Tax=Actinoplanes campanulatus TaxID=113559 RepID=A0A7W5ARQ2_9ACTN|nr:hypothetical protein [Actinoplanes campanulatus]
MDVQAQSRRVHDGTVTGDHAGLLQTLDAGAGRRLGDVSTGPVTLWGPARIFLERGVRRSA